MHGVAVDLEQVGAVLELVLLALDLPGQLPGLPHRHEPGPVAVRDRRREHKAAGLDAEHLVDLPVGKGCRECVDRPGERLRVGQQRRDVLEHDTRLRMVGDIAHVRAEERGGHSPDATYGSGAYRRLRRRCCRGRGVIDRPTAGGPAIPASATACSRGSGSSASTSTTGTPVATDAAAIVVRRRRSWRTLYFGSRSFHAARSGAATKIDEYEPTARPTDRARANSSSAVAPMINEPTINSDSTGSSATIVVVSERISTALSERLTIS